MKNETPSSWTREWANLRNKRVWFESATTSTNQIAKDLGSQYDIYITDHQSQGRGRGANSWLDTNDGASFLSSWTFNLPRPAQPIASPLFGLAVYTSLKTVWPNLPLSLKAPNDVFLGNKKLAGILLEVVSTGNQHQLILGLGINVFASPTEIPHATYLSTLGVLVTKIDWCRLLDVLETYFTEMSSLCQEHEMPANLSEQIRTALNLNPTKTDYIIKVESNGHLITESGRTPWL